MLLDMLTLYLIRHGQTNFSRDNMFCGILDPPLSSVGLQMAEALANRLGDETWDGIYASPLLRARQTIEPLAKRIGKSPELDAILKQIQSKLFTAGAEIGYGNGVKITIDDIKMIEDFIGKYANVIEDVNYFVYPTGSQSAAMLHVCRATCRRSERALFRFSKQEKVNPEILRFFNRLSSFFYILARFANKYDGVKDEKWGL